MPARRGTAGLLRAGERAPVGVARIDEACCCLRPIAAHHGRPADAVATGARPAPLAEQAVAGQARPFVPAPRAVAVKLRAHSTIPPPTLLVARTAFLC